MTLRALLTVPASVKRGEVIEVRALAQHPMETGYRRGSDGMLLPRDLIRRVEARFDGERVFDAELHAAIAANPYLAFWLRVPASGVLTVDWQGDRGVAHRESRRIEAG
jgi:sulfur-oxidizing protein SoxZ